MNVKYFSIHIRILIFSKYKKKWVFASHIYGFSVLFPIWKSWSIRQQEHVMNWIKTRTMTILIKKEQLHLPSRMPNNFQAFWLGSHFPKMKLIDCNYTFNHMLWGFLRHMLVHILVLQLWYQRINIIKPWLMLMYNLKNEHTKYPGTCFNSSFLHKVVFYVSKQNR